VWRQLSQLRVLQMWRSCRWHCLQQGAAHVEAVAVSTLPAEAGTICLHARAASATYVFYGHYSVLLLGPVVFSTLAVQKQAMHAPAALSPKVDPSSKHRFPRMCAHPGRLESCCLCGSVCSLTPPGLTLHPHPQLLLQLRACAGACEPPAPSSLWHGAAAALSA
jgi:hypothetical protein